MKLFFPVLLVFLFASAYLDAAENAKYEQADTTQTNVPPSAEVPDSGVMPLSAFFGADNAFPRWLTVVFAKVPQAATVCRWCFLINSTLAPCSPGISGLQGLTAA
ncbi:MAG: hypothetical protein VXY98_04190 [Pseudomonadota bacterium]|nr:hypothetical protein [Pseudomonadota bacterium]